MNLQHGLRCGIPMGQGRGVVYLKKYENVHLLGMVLCIVWRISVSHLGRKCYRTLFALAPTLPEGVKNRFPTQLNSREVEVEQKMKGKKTVKVKLSSRAVMKEQGLGDVCLHKRRCTQIGT